MCRNIKLLYNFKPPATEDEVHASALQYVRKVTGMRTPSKQNQEAFDAAVAQITALTRELLHEQLVTVALPRSRDVEAERAKERGQKREAQLIARLTAAAD